MAMPGPDPNFVKEQQQVLRMIGLKRAKNVKPTASAKKLLFILIPVFIVALLIVLSSAEVFSKPYLVSWNGAVYRLPHDINMVRADSKPEGVKFAGYLDPEEENASANWRPTGEVYVKEGNDKIIYLYLYSEPKGYYRARKK